MQCITMPAVKQKVLTPSMYAINVEPILPRNRNNREVHLDYLKHLKESVETLRKIVEEARIEKPLYNALGKAFLYTKSQELLEYVIGTCSKEFNKKDKKAATTPLNRKKARVNSFTEASGSKPKSNTKNNKILPAKSDKKKKVETHPRNNNKVKQVWKATGKLFANVGYQWKPTGRKFTLGEQCPLTGFTKSKVVPVKKPEHVSSRNIVITKRFSNNSQQPLTRYKCKTKLEKALSNGIPTTTETQLIDDSV
ncbi:hypothetical protein Tco_0415779 [Tanacetum coccineum]